MQTGALDTLRRTVGDDNPETLLSMSYLAGARERMGDFGLAEPLRTHVWDVRSRVLGPRHPERYPPLLCLPSTAFNSESSPKPSRSFGSPCLSSKRRFPDRGLATITNFSSARVWPDNTVTARPSLCWSRDIRNSRPAWRASPGRPAIFGVRGRLGDPALPAMGKARQGG